MVVPTVNTRLLSGVWAEAGSAVRNERASIQRPKAKGPCAPRQFRTASFGFLSAFVIRSSAFLIVNVVGNPTGVYDAGDGDPGVTRDAEGARADRAANLGVAADVQFVAGY